MKKQLFTLIVTATLTITTQLNAQNTFPTSGNVGIGTSAPTQKLQVVGGSIQTDGEVYASGWFRSFGSAGWYNQTFGGGWHMSDNTWLRTYGGKKLYCDNVIRADEGFEVDGLTVIDGNAGWHRTYGPTGWYNGTYGGGWNMSDNVWIRSFGSKSVLCDKIIRADQGFQVGDLTVIDGGGGWHRTYGATGWFNGTYGGGMYMEDNTWVRIYNNKQFYSSNIIRTDGELQAGPNGNRMVVKVGGNVGIGTINPDEKLTVKGKIHAEEVRIDLQVPADYVFEKYYTGNSLLKSNYIMPTLSEVEKFTKVNNHLPDVPSAKEIKEKGLQVGEMSNILLQKIEEMTLYIIEQNKRIEALEAKNNNK